MSTRGAAARTPQRTCVGCRGVFGKEEVVRIVAGPSGPVIDYREKLPGRAAYVCPRAACIERALGRECLSRALRIRTAPPGEERFREELASAIRDKIASLLAMATKAGKSASGFSAVEDALRKDRVAMLVFASDCSAGTREKLLNGVAAVPARQLTFSSKDALGKMTGRDQAGVIAIIDAGFADAVWREAERLKGLPNAHP